MRCRTTIALFLVTATGACALPGHYQMFLEVEKPSRKTTLHQARCKTCHVKPAGGRTLNPYGLDFHKNGANREAVAKIRQIDSDKDGFVNIDEIARGSLPGDPSSRPQPRP